MSYGPSVQFEVTIASGASSSSIYDLGCYWQYIYMHSNGASGQTIFMSTAGSATDTFRRLVKEPVNTATVASNGYYVVSSNQQAATNMFVGGLRYIRIDAAAVINNGYTINLLCSNTQL